MSSLKYVGLIVLCSVGFSAQGAESDAIQKRGVIKLKATIVGAKEQPRFISIVPWKKLNSPVIKAQKSSGITLHQLPPTSPNQIEAQEQLSRYMARPNINKE